MKKISFLLILVSILGQALSSDEMTYKPINPSFGGHPGNASWLMSSAKIQNRHEEEKEPRKDYQKDPLTQFKDNLNRQILRRLASSITDRIYGEDGINEGKFSVGDYLIDIESESSSVVIVIDDMATGNQTLLEIPNF